MSNSFGGTKKGDETLSNEPIFTPAQVEAKYHKWFPQLSSDIVSRLLKYQTELVDINKTLSLVPAGTLKNAELVHFADSILASKLIHSSLVANAPLYEFGSANGFPGLVFATLYPSVQVTIVDRDAKKLDWCKKVAQAMQLSNFSVMPKSIDELPVGSVTNVVARGVSPLQRALLVCRKQVPKGGRFFNMKNDGWANELASVPSQLFSYWSPSLLGQYKLPDTQTGLAVVLTEKIAD